MNVNIELDWNKVKWAPTQDDRELPGGPARLLARMTIGGVDFHFEAVRVIYVDGCQEATSALGEEQLNCLNALHGGADYRTANIHGSDYVIFASPFEP